jgi:glycosyltransferase involved in cell wall biosynthesis
MHDRAYRVVRGEGLWVGVPPPHLPKVPGTITTFLYARSIVRELAAFRPTHLFLRTVGIVAWQCLRYARAHRVPTLAIFASQFRRPERPHERFVVRQLVHHLNDPLVSQVANHRRPATRSMVDLGVDEKKTVAWDFEGLRRPEGQAVKSEPRTAPSTILYVGSMIELKGVGDLIEAVRLLRERGRQVRLLCAGDGRDAARLRELAARAAPGAVEMLGSIGNDRAFALMREVDLVCIPSRHQFPEGMPLTVTEALASRTPTITSDHPVLTEAFRDGEGVKFFRASDPADLARVADEVLSTPALYARLSETAPAAFDRAVCPTTFRQLVEAWSAGLPDR